MDKTENYTRMKNGQPYICDEYCQGLMRENRRKLHEFNNADCWSDDGIKHEDELLRGILGRAGKDLTILPPFYCDYGAHIEVGDNFFANYNLVILDVADVKIGNNVFFAPNVSIYTAGHPIHPDARNSMYEYGLPVTIGDNCWLGGNVVVCPGVTIGRGCVIGAGSVVLRDIPDNTVAAGNPCRVIREITDEDINYYFRDRRFTDAELERIGKRR